MLATFAVAELVRVFAEQATALTGGGDGPTTPAVIPLPGQAPLRGDADTYLYLLACAAGIATARLSVNPNDFALIALLGLLGLRIFEACGPTLPTWARNTATGYCACRVPCRAVLIVVSGNAIATEVATVDTPRPGLLKEFLVLSTPPDRKVQAG